MGGNAGAIGGLGGRLFVDSNHSGGAGSIGGDVRLETGTLITLFPVTDETVIQSQLTMKDEPELKLETDKKLLPREGAPAKLIIEVK